MAPSPQLREQLATERDRLAGELERSISPTALPAGLDGRYIPGVAGPDGDGRRTRLHELTVALTRMDTGEWGACAACRAPIEEERLESSPVATHCGSCASTGLLQPRSLLSQ